MTYRTREEQAAMTIDGYVHLAFAILRQAYRDTQSCNRDIRRVAFDYLNGPEAFNLAEMLGYDPGRLLKWAKNATRKPRTGANCLSGDLLPAVQTSDSIIDLVR